MRIPWQLSGLTGLVGLLMSSAMSNPVLAQVPLTRADVEALQNNVEYLPERGIARAAALSDWLTLGDAIRTATASRADLRFNDGSLARIGEQATFWFVPNTRNFRLSNGTALLLVPPGRGASTIETPSAITGIQGTAVVIRHIPESPVVVAPDASPRLTSSPGRTIVMALTNNPAGPVVVELPNGGQVSLVAGQMAIASDNQLEVFEFDLRLFYETSPLVADLHLDDPSFAEGSSPTAPVRQETLDALSQQANFVGLSWLNPDVLDQQVSVATDLDWQVSANSYRSGLVTNNLEAALPHLTDAGMGPVSVDFVGQEPVVAQPTLDASSVSGQNGLIPTTVDSISDMNAIALPPGVLEPVASPSVVPATPILPAMPAVPTTPVEPVNPVIPADPVESVEPVDPVIPAVVADPVADDDLENPENRDD